jgi:hypothetical protein
MTMVYYEFELYHVIISIFINLIIYYLHYELLVLKGINNYQQINTGDTYTFVAKMNVIAKQ